MGRPRREDWIKLHIDMKHNPKVMRLAPDLFRTYILALLQAGETGGEKGLIDVDRLAYDIRTDTERVENDLETLVSRSLIDRLTGGKKGFNYAAHDWNEWQDLPDKPKPSTDRVKRFRARVKNAVETRYRNAETPLEERRLEENVSFHETIREDERENTTKGSGLSPAKNAEPLAGARDLTPEEKSDFSKRLGGLSAFDLLWETFAVLDVPNASKANARAAFDRLTLFDQRRCLDALGQYVDRWQELSAKRQAPAPMHLENFINRRLWAESA